MSLIAQIANFYGPRSGGLRTALNHLGPGYRAAGHDVVLIVPAERRSDERLPNGVRRITIPAPKIPGTGGYRAVDPVRVKAVLERLRPDAIEVSDRLTLRGLGRWAAQRGIPSVVISHERLDRLLGQIMPATAARLLADKANARMASNYDRVVCTTAFAREEFDRIHAPNISQVPLGVDLGMFDPRLRDDDLRADLAQGARNLIVHCGRLSPEKHVERSIDAAAQLTESGYDIKLVIAGDGRSRAALERHANGLPVRFLGFLENRGELAKLLASADVSLAPGPHETFGLAALESLASGTPVVVSASSALSEIVRPECGAAVGDEADQFASAVGTVLGSPEPQRRLAARERAEQFTWPNAVHGMLSAFGMP